MLGAIPFGLAAGIAAVEAGVPAWSASGGEETAPRRAAMAYLMTDQIVAVTATKLVAEPDHGPRWAYCMGGAAWLWVAWQVCSVIGAVAGSVIPDSVPLGFAVPLVLAAPLPANVGLLLAAATAITVGVATRRRSPGPSTSSGASS